MRGEVVGPAGPTTATRMDKFTEMMLEKTGLIAMVGKAERGPAGIEAIRKHRAAYLMAVGGAAYLVSKAIKASRVVAFEDLGMEAIYEFTVEDMPVTVAVDANGTSVHQTGPARVEPEDRRRDIPACAPAIEDPACEGMFLTNYLRGSPCASPRGNQQLTMVPRARALSMRRLPAIICAR